MADQSANCINFPSFSFPTCKPPPKVGGVMVLRRVQTKMPVALFFLSSPHAGPPHKGGGHGATESADKNASGAFFFVFPTRRPPPQGGGVMVLRRVQTKMPVALIFPSVPTYRHPQCGGGLLLQQMQKQSELFLLFGLPPHLGGGHILPFLLLYFLLCLALFGGFQPATKKKERLWREALACLPYIYICIYIHTYNIYSS